MKIRCPKCSHVIQLDIPKIPTTGIEINCPSCAARFRLRGKEEPSAQGASATPPPSTSAAPVASGNAANSAIFGGGLQSFEDDVPDTPPAASVAKSSAASSGSSAPAGTLDGLADLLQELDDLQGATGPAAQSMFQVRGQRGNVFGPFDAKTILNMLDTGQLNGKEELTQDGKNWQPMQEWSEFSAKVSVLLADQKAAVPPSVDLPPPTPAKAAYSGASTAATVVPAVSTPAKAQPVVEEPAPAEPTSSKDDMEIRRIERKAPQRIRSALKEDVMEAENQRTFSMENLNALKENIESIDKKWFIMGGSGLGIIVILSVVAIWIFSGPKKIHYKNIDIPVERPFAVDSYTEYTKKLLPRIIGELRNQPKHPQLQAYLAVSLAMYLEHYGPNAELLNRLNQTIKSFPPPSPENKPTFLEHWAYAMYAIVRNHGGDAWKYVQLMKKMQSTHYAVPYVEAKALALRGLHAQALTRYSQAVAVLSSPVRVSYARGLLHLRTKKITEACQSFYQTTVVNKEHYPAFLSLLELEQQCTIYKDRYTRIWKEVGALSKRLESSMVKSRFSYLLAQRASREKKPNLALRHLLAAIRLQPTYLKYQEHLPDFYLATYDYNKTLHFLQQMLKRSGTISPQVTTSLLQVLFRIGQFDEARRQLKSLFERCPTCKEDHDFWLWRARIEENTKLENQAINSLNEALYRKPKSVAAFAAKARVAWKANHPKITKEILVQVKPLPLLTLWDRVNLAELYQLLKQPKEAYDVLEPLLPAHPRDEYINRMAGSLLLSMDRAVDAEKHFRQALQTWSKDDESVQGLAISLDAQNKYKESIAFYQKAISANPNLASNHYRLGRALYLMKDYQKALYSLRQSLEREDRNAEAHYYAALAMESLGEKDTKQIEEHLNRAVALAPTNLTYQLHLAQFYSKKRQINKTLEIYERLLEGESLSQEQRLTLLKEKGKLHYELKNWKTALNDFRKLYKLDPKQSIALRWIADCYVQMNQTANAISWYQKALNHYLKTKPKTTETALVTPEMQRWKQELSDVYAKLGDLERSRDRQIQAIKWYRSAVQTNPDNPGNYRQLGYLHKDKSQWAACIKNFSIYLKKASANDIDRAEAQKDMEACQSAYRGR